MITFPILIGLLNEPYQNYSILAGLIGSELQYPPFFSLVSIIALSGTNSLNDDEDDAEINCSSPKSSK